MDKKNLEILGNMPFKNRTVLHTVLRKSLITIILKGAKLCFPSLLFSFTFLLQEVKELPTETEDKK